MSSWQRAQLVQQRDEFTFFYLYHQQLNFSMQRHWPVCILPCDIDTPFPELPLFPHVTQVSPSLALPLYYEDTVPPIIPWAYLTLGLWYTKDVCRGTDQYPSCLVTQVPLPQGFHSFLMSHRYPLPKSFHYTMKVQFLPPFHELIQLWLVVHQRCHRIPTQFLICKLSKVRLLVLLFTNGVMLTVKSQASDFHSSFKFLYKLRPADVLKLV
jgi:hypothetical protein